jgi:hypothetical protein
MVTSGSTGHDRCPSQLSRAHSAPKYHPTGGDKKISKGRFGFKGESKNFAPVRRPAEREDPTPAVSPLGWISCGREGVEGLMLARQAAEPSCRFRGLGLSGPTAPSVPIFPDLVQLVSQPLGKPAQTIDLHLPEYLFNVCVLCHWHAAPIVR